LRALIVPTARPGSLIDFLTRWRPWPWDAAVVIEDAPEITLDRAQLVELADGRDVALYSWKEIEAELAQPWIISRRDSAIRAFGFWKGWQRGAETLFTLDDDCYPTDDDFVQGHLDNLERTPRWESTVPGLRVRGLPYKNLGNLDTVRASIGLWSGVPDLDAVQSLANEVGATDAALVARVSTRVLPSEQYFPISGMNLAVSRDVACLMYYPPMGQDSPYRRFDDIWCGLVLQRVFRHLGFRIVCGRPLVDHQRASNPFVNLEKEGAGVRENERIWEAVDGVELTATTPLACMEEMGIGLERRGEDGDEYLHRWGRAIREWCKLFEG
jgi:Reversibly glycosylated polypeptide